MREIRVFLVLALQEPNGHARMLQWLNGNTQNNTGTWSTAEHGSLGRDSPRSIQSCGGRFIASEGKKSWESVAVVASRAARKRRRWVASRETPMPSSDNGGDSTATPNTVTTAKQRTEPLSNETTTMPLSNTKSGDSRDVDLSDLNAKRRDNLSTENDASSEHRIVQSIRELQQVYLYGLQTVSTLQDLRGALDAIMPGNFTQEPTDTDK